MGQDALFSSYWAVSYGTMTRKGFTKNTWEHGTEHNQALRNAKLVFPS